MTRSPRQPWDSTRKSAFAAGVLYLITFAASIPAALLISSALAGPDAISTSGVAAEASLGAVLELVNAIAAIGTAVAVFAVIRREHEGLAIGFVATRLFEAAVLAVGVVGVMAFVTVNQAATASAEPAAYLPIGQALVATREWSVLIGPGMAAFNALMFGTALYRARLVPRAIPALGMVGSPLLIAFVIGTMLGVTGPGTLFQGIAVAPFFIWELVIGCWMVVKGFDPASPILAGRQARADVPRPESAVAATGGAA
jgi:hypothetical protein